MAAVSEGQLDAVDVGDVAFILRLRGLRVRRCFGFCLPQFALPLNALPVEGCLGAQVAGPVCCLLSVPQGGGAGILLVGGCFPGSRWLSRPCGLFWASCCFCPTGLIRRVERIGKRLSRR